MKKGIKINNKDFILTQYADDTTVILDGLRKHCMNLKNSLNDLDLKLTSQKRMWCG